MKPSSLELAIQALKLDLERAKIGRAAGRAAAAGAEYIDDAAFISTLLIDVADQVGGSLGDALYRTHRAFLRELHNEGLITREEAGLRRARVTR